MRNQIGYRLKEDKKLITLLANLKGLSNTTINKIGCSLGIKFSHKIFGSQLANIQDLLLSLKLFFGGAIRYKTELSRERLRLAKHRKALRFIQGLPVRGQRTKTNAQTARKNKLK